MRNIRYDWRHTADQGGGSLVNRRIEVFENVRKLRGNGTVMVTGRKVLKTIYKQDTPFSYYEEAEKFAERLVRALNSKGRDREWAVREIQK